MARGLTTKGVEALRHDPERRLEIPDPALSGLYVIIQPSGSKSWALRYRHAGKPKKLTLGRWPVMGVAEARSAASEALEAIEHDRDPSAEKKAARIARNNEPNRDTVRGVIDLFMRRHVSHNRRVDDVAALFRREVLATWGDRDIRAITKRDVIEILDAIVDRGSPITANRVRANLSSLFNWARGRDIIQASPVDGIRPPAPENARDRVLADDEIRWFWTACDGLGYPFGPLYRLLLLTGQRLREVAEMTWSEVNGEQWTIPAARAKNGAEHVVPLSQAARRVLDAIPRMSDRFVFTTTSRSPVSGFARAKGRVDVLMSKAAEEQLGPAAEVTPFVIHDLRRTAATGGLPRLSGPV